MKENEIITRFIKMDQWGRFTLSKVDREVLGLEGGETFEVTLKLVKTLKKDP